MSRTVEEIYNEIVTEKETFAALALLLPNPETFQTLLTDADSGSRVASWRTFAAAVAISMQTQEELWDIKEEELEALSNTLHTGTAIWYHAKVLEFQLGDSLTWNGAQYVYDPIDTTKQIVKRAAIIEFAGGVTVKAAKLDGGGDPEKLTTPEADALSSYLNQIGFAGTEFRVISKDADLLKTAYTVKYDPQVIDFDGSLLSDPATFPVEDAINGYISNLPFSGVFSINSMTDAIQKVNGVINPVHTATEAKSSDLGAIYQVVTDEYEPDAGYLKIDPAFPLSTQITYSV